MIALSKQRGEGGMAGGGRGKEGKEGRREERREGEEEGGEREKGREDVTSFSQGAFSSCPLAWTGEDFS